MKRAARVSGSLTRTWMAGCAVAVFVATAGTGFAQQQQQPPPPPPTPPQQQTQPAPAAPEPPDQLKFTIDGPVVLINQIKTDKAADFEAAWADIRAAIAKTDKAEVKAFGETLTKLYKVDLPPADMQGVKTSIYVFHIDTPSKSHSYNPVKILYETLHGGGVLTREEADAIYAKLKDSYASINPWPLVKVG